MDGNSNGQRDTEGGRGEGGDKRGQTLGKVVKSDGNTREQSHPVEATLVRDYNIGDLFKFC